MKYYIYSPVGRTASKRIFESLASTISIQNEDTSRFSIGADGTTYLLKAEQEAVTYEKSSAISVLSNWENSVAVHSHNFEVLPSDSDWTFVLSARKRKIDTVLSRLLALESHSVHPSIPTKPGFSSFEISSDKVEALIEECIEKENAFVDAVRALGKEPIVVYLEDSYQAIQDKINFDFDSSVHGQNTFTISKLKAADYVTNYNELQSNYDTKVEDYASRFFSETE
jgi:hypothetical protein